eukprot:131867_1
MSEEREDTNSLSQHLDLVNRMVARWRIMGDSEHLETAWEEIRTNHQRKISQLASWMEVFGNVDDTTRRSREEMKSRNPLHLQRIEVINYRMILHRVLKNNNNETDQVDALKSELKIYFAKPIANHIATNCIKHWT